MAVRVEKATLPGGGRMESFEFGLLLPNFQLPDEVKIETHITLPWFDKAIVAEMKEDNVSFQLIGDPTDNARHKVQAMFLQEISSHDDPSFGWDRFDYLGGGEGGGSNLISFIKLRQIRGSYLASIFEMLDSAGARPFRSIKNGRTRFGIRFYNTSADLSAFFFFGRLEHEFFYGVEVLDERTGLLPPRVNNDNLLTASVAAEEDDVIPQQAQEENNAAAMITSEEVTEDEDDEAMINPNNHAVDEQQDINQMQHMTVNELFRLLDNQQQPPVAPAIREFVNGAFPHAMDAMQTQNNTPVHTYIAEILANEVARHQNNNIAEYVHGGQVVHAFSAPVRYEFVTAEGIRCFVQEVTENEVLRFEYEGFDGKRIAMEFPWDHSTHEFKVYQRADHQPINVRIINGGNGIPLTMEAMKLEIPVLNDRKVEVITGQVESKRTNKKRVEIKKSNLGFTQTSSVSKGALKYDLFSWEASETISYETATDFFQDTMLVQNVKKGSFLKKSTSSQQSYNVGDNRQITKSEKSSAQTTYKYKLFGGNYGQESRHSEVWTATVGKNQRTQNVESYESSVVAQFTTEHNNGQRDVGFLSKFFGSSAQNVITRNGNNLTLESKFSSNSGIKSQIEGGGYKTSGVKVDGTKSMSRDVGFIASNEQSITESTRIEYSDVNLTGKTGASLQQEGQVVKSKVQQSLSKNPLCSTQTKLIEDKNMADGTVTQRSETSWQLERAGAKSVANGVGGLLALIQRFGSGKAVNFEDLVNVAGSSIQGLAEGQLLEIIDGSSSGLNDSAQANAMSIFGVAYVAISFARHYQQAWVRGIVTRCDTTTDATGVKTLALYATKHGDSKECRIDADKIPKRVFRDETLFRGREVWIYVAKDPVTGNPYLVDDLANTAHKAVILDQKGAWDITGCYFDVKFVEVPFLGLCLQKVNKTRIHLTKPGSPESCRNNDSNYRVGDLILFWPEGKTLDVTVNTALDAVSAFVQAIIALYSKASMTSTPLMIVLQTCISTMRMALMYSRGEMTSTELWNATGSVLVNSTISATGGMGAIAAAQMSGAQSLVSGLAWGGSFGVIVMEVIVFSLGAAGAFWCLAKMNEGIAWWNDRNKYLKLARSLGLDAQSDDRMVMRRLRFRSLKRHPDKGDKNVDGTQTSSHNGVITSVNWSFFSHTTYEVTFYNGETVQDIWRDVPHSSIDRSSLHPTSYKIGDKVSMTFEHSNDLFQQLVADFDKLAEYRLIYEHSKLYNNGYHTSFSFITNSLKWVLEKFKESTWTDVVKSEVVDHLWNEDEVAKSVDQMNGLLNPAHSSPTPTDPPGTNFTEEESFRNAEQQATFQGLSGGN